MALTNNQVKYLFKVLLEYPLSLTNWPIVRLAITHLSNQINLLDLLTDTFLEVNKIPQSLHLKRCLFCCLPHLIVLRLLQAQHRFFLMFSSNKKSLLKLISINFAKTFVYKAYAGFYQLFLAIKPEFSKAIELDKPRWFVSHHYVTFARDLLSQYMFRGSRNNRSFTFKKTPVLDKAEVIHMYNEAIQNHLKPGQRKSHWAQPFFRTPEIFPFIKTQFYDMGKRITELEKLNNTENE